MSPSNFNAKKETNPNVMYPYPPLKINKDSYFIKKSPPSSSCASSSSSSASASVSALSNKAKPQHRPPVIIYTHAPKVIHTNPSDFMALVQKLTGLSKTDENPNPIPKKEIMDVEQKPQNLKLPKTSSIGESNSSFLEELDCFPSTMIDDIHINSYFQPMQTFDPNISPCFNNIPMFNTLNDGFSSIEHPYYNKYDDPLCFTPNTRSSTSSSTSMEAILESCEF